MLKYAFSSGIDFHFPAFSKNEDNNWKFQYDLHVKDLQPFHNEEKLLSEWAETELWIPCITSDKIFHLALLKSYPI
jgi:hypothetical protein